MYVRKYIISVEKIYLNKISIHIYIYNNIKSRAGATIITSIKTTTTKSY